MAEIDGDRWPVRPTFLGGDSRPAFWLVSHPSILPAGVIAFTTLRECRYWLEHVANPHGAACA